jgi:hypothetical protein
VVVVDAEEEEGGGGGHCPTTTTQTSSSSTQQQQEGPKDTYKDEEEDDLRDEDFVGCSVSFARPISSGFVTSSVLSMAMSNDDLLLSGEWVLAVVVVVVTPPRITAAAPLTTSVRGAGAEEVIGATFLEEAVPILVQQCKQVGSCANLLRPAGELWIVWVRKLGS